VGVVGVLRGSRQGGSGTIVLVAVVAVVAVSVFRAAPAAAFGYRSTGFDPNDRPVDKSSCCQQDPDLRSTTRKVWVDKNERAWLSITFRAYERLIGYWTVFVKLDTRGGQFADWRMRIRDPANGRPGCGVRKPHAREGHHAYYSSPRDGSRATCRVPMWLLEPNKRIRWKLFSPRGSEGTGRRVNEFAPDRGWYE